MTEKTIEIIPLILQLVFLKHLKYVNLLKSKQKYTSNIINVWPKTLWLTTKE
jgi:hypothetical protein